mmetsp:Transcript_33340/g.33848  ORF Transcript_33340/g.33848 Transcript_33340/m.33848 type:complete len:84 (+) Transcript_33340:306-557(+)
MNQSACINCYFFSSVRFPCRLSTTTTLFLFFYFLICLPLPLILPLQTQTQNSITTCNVVILEMEGAAEGNMEENVCGSCPDDE